MKGLRTIRIILSVVFFLAAVAYLGLDLTTNPLAKATARVQIVPSMLATTMGMTIVWIVISFLLGRVYCSTVCPIGTLQDAVIWVCERVPRLRRLRPHSYRPARQVRWHILLIYIIALILGVAAVSYWIEPWNIMRNICSVANPADLSTTWATLGVGVAAGIASGVVSLLLIIVCVVFTGRGFCTTICPVGTALGSFHNFTLYHIEIDPDRCINCMKCEEVCKSNCVKVAGRYVDNSRCVRCFDCLGVCPNDAIRFQANRNRPATPLFRKQTAR